MSKMGEMHMLITEWLGDGMDENEIADNIAKDFDVDRDFAFVLVEELIDELYEHENRSDVSNPTWGA